MPIHCDIYNNGSQTSKKTAAACTKCSVFLDDNLSKSDYENVLVFVSLVAIVMMYDLSYFIAATSSYTYYTLLNRNCIYSSIWFSS